MHSFCELGKLHADCEGGSTSCLLPPPYAGSLLGRRAGAEAEAEECVWPGGADELRNQSGGTIRGAGGRGGPAAWLLSAVGSGLWRGGLRVSCVEGEKKTHLSSSVELAWREGRRGEARPNDGELAKGRVII